MNICQEFHSSFEEACLDPIGHRVCDTSYKVQLDRLRVGFHILASLNAQAQPDADACHVAGVLRRGCELRTVHMEPTRAHVELGRYSERVEVRAFVCGMHSMKS